MNAIAAMLVVLAGQCAWAAGDGLPSSAASNHSTGTPSSAAEKLQEVTVTAHRIELESAVSTFVNQISGMEKMNPLALLQGQDHHQRRVPTGLIQAAPYRRSI